MRLLVESTYVMQVKQSYIQTNEAPPGEVFPLLCPVREKEWLEGWDYEMVHSKSGLNELDCVFLTGHQGPTETVWITTEYDPQAYRLGFARLTPGVMAVRILITLSPLEGARTQTHITYIYTALSPEGASYLKHDVKQDFAESMRAWEQAINHFLQTGEMKRMLDTQSS